MRSELPFLERSGSSLDPPAYRIEGDGPPLIYLAGLDGTGELFFKQTSRLTHTYRVVTFRSREQGDFTYEDLSSDVAAIISDLGERRATIVGESFGGTVALSFALAYPKLVERLIVVNSFARFRSRLTIRLGSALARGVPFQMLWPLRRAGSALGLFIDGVDAEGRQRFWKAIRTVNGEAYARRLQLIAGLNLEDRLAEIQAPTLFIAGDRDLLLPSVKEAFSMAARISRARVEVIRGAGHACLLGNRVRLDEILAE